MTPSLTLCKWYRGTDTDAAITLNSGGYHTSVEAGDITPGQVLTMMPFGNAIIDLTLIDINLKQIVADTHSCVSSDLVALCLEAAMQQIQEKMDLIDLEEDTDDAEVSDSYCLFFFFFGSLCFYPATATHT